MVQAAVEPASLMLKVSVILPSLVAVWLSLTPLLVVSELLLRATVPYATDPSETETEMFWAVTVAVTVPVLVAYTDATEIRPNQNGSGKECK